MNKIHAPLALKLHAYGLRNLHDPNWTGMELYDHLKQHVRGRVEPTDLLQKTLKNGLLYCLGMWLFEEYVFDENYFLDIGDEYRVWFLEDLYDAILKLGPDPREEALVAVKSKIDAIDRLYDEDEHEYWKYLNSEEGVDELHAVYLNLITAYKSILDLASKEYAANYADRVFHDRQLCEYISKTIVLIGFDGSDWLDATCVPKQWVKRRSWPEWAKKAVRARDRGKCSECGADMVSELERDESIDHIVPLTKGGNNDLVNLQLLCVKCNLIKGTMDYEVKSSIPPYIGRALHKSRK